MISRLRQGSIVLFKHLSFLGLFKIAKHTLESEISKFQKTYDLDIEPLKSDLITALILHQGPNFDVRAINSKISTISSLEEAV